MSSARKDDDCKPDLSLNPRVALEEMARAFMLGEKKYGRYNFYKGLESSRLIAACLRHLHAWNDGEDNDEESGNSHLGHALACIAMLLQQQKLSTLRDNRYNNKSEQSTDVINTTITTIHDASRQLPVVDRTLTSGESWTNTTDEELQLWLAVNGPQTKQG